MDAVTAVPAEAEALAAEATEDIAPRVTSSYELPFDAPAVSNGHAATSATSFAVVADAPAAPSPTAQKAEPFVLPTDALRNVAEGAGLQWVMSDADKVRAVQDAMANEPKPVRVPREPKVQALPDEGPLVLVETRRDLSNLFDAR